MKCKIIILFLCLCVAAYANSKVTANIITIHYIDKYEIYIMTEYGGDNFQLTNIKIQFNESINNPVGFFTLNEYGTLTRANNRGTLVFKNNEQAREWLKNTGEVSINGNVNSNISASYSRTENKGCFISSLLIN